MKGLKLLVVVAAILLLPAATFAQDAGGFTGTVSDPKGAVVAGATVTISNGAAISKTVLTDDKGVYSVPDLPPGKYTITVKAAGFKEFSAPDVSLEAGASLPIDATLELPAAEIEQVNVTAGGAAQVNTENPEVSGTITTKEIQKIQLNGRNFTQLIALAPGVSNQTGQDEGKVGPQGSVKFSVNGGRVEYNSFDVDGSDLLNTGLNGATSTLVVFPSLEALQEVKVLTSNYGARYGRTASGTVLVTTKTGGDQFHGVAYEFVRNEIFNARNYFDPPGNAPLYRRQDFGGAIGGSK